MFWWCASTKQGKRAVQNARVCASWIIYALESATRFDRVGILSSQAAQRRETERFVRSLADDEGFCLPRIPPCCLHFFKGNFPRHCLAWYCIRRRSCGINFRGKSYRYLALWKNQQVSVYFCQCFFACRNHHQRESYGCPKCHLRNYDLELKNNETFS